MTKTDEKWIGQLFRIENTLPAIERLHMSEFKQQDGPFGTNFEMFFQMDHFEIQAVCLEAACISMSNQTPLTACIVEELLKTVEKSPSNIDRGRICELHRLATCLVSSGLPHLAERLLETANILAIQKLDATDMVHVRLCCQWGYVKILQNKLPRACQEYSQAIRIAEAGHQPNSILYRLYYALGCCHGLAKERVPAIEALTKAMKLAEEWFPKSFAANYIIPKTIALLLKFRSLA